jgi:uncharacterized protein
MTLANGTRPATGPPPADLDARPRSRHHLLTTTALVGGAGAAFLVGHDGSLGWQLVRVVAVAGLTCVILMTVRSGSRLRRAAAAFPAGCAGVAVGVGVGLPHLAKTGLRLTTVAGLCVLAAGLVLLGYGGAVLVQAAPRWWRVLVVPGVVLTLAVALLTLGQAVAATNVPATSLGSATPAERGLTYRDVEFDTADRVTLSGWYVPSTNGAAVVLLHGSGSTRSDVLEQAAVLAGHGFGALLFDARGHGRSGGRAMDFGWYGDQDTAAAVSFVQAQPDVDDTRIGVLGLSMGGEQAVGAAAFDPRIRAVVAEGATNRVAADKAWQAEEFGWRGAVQNLLDRVTYGITDQLTQAEPPTSLRNAVARAAPRPVLLIAGGAVQDEPSAARYIASGSPDTVEVWVVPETGHTDALGTDEAEWDRRVTSFLAAALGTR